MKRFLIALLAALLLLASGFALAGQETEYLSAAVSAPDAVLSELPLQDAKTLLTLRQGESVTVTALGVSYCEVQADGISGYLRTDEMTFDILNGDKTCLALVDVAHTNLSSGRLTMRESADKSAGEIDKLCRGEIVLVIEKGEDFWHIATADHTGYAMSGYFADAEPKEYTLACVRNDAAVSLRLVREYADQYVITNLAPGQVVQVISDRKGWAFIEASGARGYIVSEYLGDME